MPSHRANLLLSIGLAGCRAAAAPGSPSPPDPRLQSIEQRIEASERRLEQLKVEITTSEQRAEQAQQAATTQKCLAENAEIGARVVATQASCLEQVATYNMCEAQAAERRANATIVGCLFGIAVATATVGAGIPLALGGCALGSAVGSSSCTAPDCARDLDRVERQVLGRMRLAELPLCGGYAGMAVEDDVVEEQRGIRISKVGSGTTAASLGLGKGDVLFAIDGNIVGSERDAAKALARSSIGGKVRAKVVRRQRVLLPEGEVRDVRLDGTRQAGAPQLGAVVEPTTPRVKYSSGARVVRLDADGPAAAELAVGDLIIGVDGVLVQSRDDVRRVMSVKPSGTVVRLTIAGAQKGARSVELVPRKGRKGI